MDRAATLYGALESGCALGFIPPTG